MSKKQRYFSIVDTQTLAITTVEDDALQSGLEESADGLTLYVAEGQTDMPSASSVVPLRPTVAWAATRRSPTTR